MCLKAVANHLQAIYLHFLLMMLSYPKPLGLSSASRTIATLLMSQEAVLFCSYGDIAVPVAYQA